MTKISTVETASSGEHFLRNIDDTRPRLHKPDSPEYSDNLYGDQFSAAMRELDLVDEEGNPLQPEYHHGRRQLELTAPEGMTFRVKGRFQTWPDGSHDAWSYGPPSHSFEVWQERWEEEVEQAMTRYGMTRAEAIAEVEEWSDELRGGPPDEYFSGPSLSLQVNRVNWGRTTKTSSVESVSSDDERSMVQVNVYGYATTWMEQARQLIRLPGASGDRMDEVHEYGQPMSVPCWSGELVEGMMSDIEIELAPIVGTAEREKHLSPHQRLWVPERLRWSLVDQYPELIDHHGDYQSRTNHGGAIRMLGTVANAFAEKSGNFFDDHADKSKLMIVDDEHADTIPLHVWVDALEELIEEHNRIDDPRAESRRQEDAEFIGKVRKELATKLLAITEHHGTLHDIVSQYGESDDWLEEHLKGFDRF